MATKRKSSRQPKQSGSTMYGALAGLLVGLIIAAVVAFYVTKAPMPFVDRATRDADRTKLPDPRQAPDPNQGLYGRDGAAGTPPSGPTATAPAPLPGVQPAAPAPSKGQSDELGALIATLPPGTPPEAPAARAPAPASGKYFLQAGAYRVLEDAEGLKARILLLGLPVAVQRAEVNGMQVNRVRVGPFARLDDMNRARSLLGENKIESAVVRQ
ncbi:SPOR domain-containing protein [Bordetella petrii]|uniref:Membrane protein n=1 Tax=Bordetella petrii (strain ATCC BAA-461 / DSM 12804 / CCUG 43448 / CIP 107267 / Se-1111R) TaxID=340100 RepID=A9HVX2_BORPD|nr:SPOR domain-containing protein [Bordetella petrii]CAP40399.1 putative membrane protein [Bordetella petrii]